MKPTALVACFVLLVGGCAGLTPLPPTAAPGPTDVATAPPGTTPSPEVRRWSEYHSESKGFSLQLPADWSVQPGIPAEDVLLQIDGGAEGRLLLSEDFPQRDETFEAYYRRYFRALLAADPNAVEVIHYQGGRAARGTIAGVGGLTVSYLFQPSRGAAKVLAFGWEGSEPHPVWEMIAERFNPHSPRVIIPLATPSPAG